MNDQIKIEKRIHPGYKEWEDSGKAFPRMFGKYQYFYTYKKEEISLISLPNYYGDVATLWEIYNFSSKLFEGIRRFRSKKEAEKAIEKYLLGGL